MTRSECSMSDRPSSTEDTEFLLTTGKLITLFLGLVVVCALFFGFGYMLGRGSAKQGGSIVADMQAQAAANTKPQPTQDAPKSGDCPAGQICPPATPQDMTFYKSVEGKDANAQLTPATTPQNPPTTAPAAKEPQPTEPSTTAAAAVTGHSVGMGYMVQVAAVSKREDAELLKTALEAKSYPVVITAAANDKLFHVQVGPSSDIKEAETWKAKLIADGYNPLLKK